MENNANKNRLNEQSGYGKSFNRNFYYLTDFQLAFRLFQWQFNKGILIYFKQGKVDF